MSGAGLLDLQRGFARALLEGDDEGIAGGIAADSERARRQVAIYRRAVVANLVGALRGAHPVVVRLVGDAFFHEAARRFALGNPPSTGDLNRFGAGFGDFLASYEPASGLPWLADVAKLDWACHEASMAADGEPLDTAALALVPEAAQGGLRFGLHPSVRLVRSAWPILALWEANQPGRDGTPDRDEGEDEVLAWRRSGEVRAMRLSRPQAAFVEAIAAGRTLAEAADSGDWEMAPFLAELARQGVLGAFRVEIPRGGEPISA